MHERMPLHDVAWDDVRLFLAIAETGSLSRASKRLRVAQPTVSRRLAELEQRLGFPLFVRQVAGVTLTSGGERLVEPARRMAEWAAELGRAAGESEAGPRGVVRITAPPGVAFDFVAPFATVVRDRYPALRLEVLGAVRPFDLNRGEADLALRLLAATGRDLVTLATLEVQNRVVVSRAYRERLPAKPTLADLDWIAWAPPFEHVPPNPELAAVIPDWSPVFTSDDFVVQWRACEAGVGAMLTGYVKHRFSLSSSMVPLDLSLGPHASSKLHLLAAKGALGTPRVRAVADLIVEEWKRFSKK